MTGTPSFLQQTVHGYSEGHRLLAASFKLSAKDAKVLLQLSDAASSGLRVDDDAYLTGYPLVDSGYYVLAKTWPAAEMPRPGCVWTHSLFIPLSELGLIDDLARVAALFRRPDPKVSGFNNALELVSLDRRRDFDLHDAMSVFSGLYGKPTSKIVYDRPSDGGDDVVLAVWSQQWPSLRANFRFCTGTSADRSMPGHEFDLQLITGGQGARTRFTKSVIASDVTSFNGTAWHRHGFRDLMQPNAEGFRTFSRSVGHERQLGRRAFAHLAQFNLFLRDENNPASTTNAVQFLRENLKAIQSRDLRAEISNRIVEQLHLLDDATVSFLLEDLSVVEQRSAADYAKIGTRVLSNSVPDFWALGTTDIGARAIAATIQAMSQSGVLSVLFEDPSRAIEVIALRPSIVTSASFWENKSYGQHELGAAIDHDQAVLSGVGNAILDAGRHDLASDLSEAIGREPLFDQIWGRVVQRGIDPALRPWFDMLCADRQAMAGYLSRGDNLSITTLNDVAYAIPPDDLPNRVGADPWLTATRHLPWQRQDGPTIALASYLYTRALGPSSRSSGELAAQVLPFLHEAAANNRIDDEIWSALSKRLPKSLFGWDWDRCWRLRAAFVDLVVSGQPPSAFANLRADDQLFMAVAHWAMRSSRGRDYLWKVLGELPRNSNRGSNLAKLLKD